MPDYRDCSHGYPWDNIPSGEMGTPSNQAIESERQVRQRYLEHQKRVERNRQEALDEIKLAVLQYEAHYGRIDSISVERHVVHKTSNGKSISKMVKCVIINKNDYE